MKPSEVYIRAAELIVSSNTFGCCYAIYFTTKDNATIFTLNPLVISFTELFKPEITLEDYWFGLFTPENQRARVLALYLMAEIAKELE